MMSSLAETHAQVTLLPVKCGPEYKLHSHLVKSQHGSKTHVTSYEEFYVQSHHILPGPKDSFYITNVLNKLRPLVFRPNHKC